MNLCAPFEQFCCSPSRIAPAGMVLMPGGLRLCQQNNFLAICTTATFICELCVNLIQIQARDHNLSACHKVREHTISAIHTERQVSRAKEYAKKSCKDMKHLADYCTLRSLVVL
eukprot:1540421-Amphidinium_carterae.1